MMETYLTEFEAYLAETDRAALTVRGYVGDLRLFVRWYAEAEGEPCTLEKVTAGAIRHYKAHLLGRQCRPNTINRRLASLAAFTHWARQVGYLETPRNPVQDVKSVQQVALAPRWLPPREQAALLRTVADEVAKAVRRYPRLWFLFVRDAAVVQLLLNTGLRLHEVAALELGDVQVSERSGKVVVRQGKGQKHRELPLNAPARQALQAYLAARPQGGSQAFFTGQRGEGVQAKTVRRAVQRFAKPAGVAATPHILRHTFAKNLVNKGVSLEKVAALMGHSNLNTTRIYTLPGETDLEEAVGRLG